MTSYAVGIKLHNILASKMSDRRKTVLIVDNDEEVRESLTAMLRRDFRILRAGTGEGALQMMEKEDVDLMVVDVHLPGITGFEVLKIAKENHPHVEVIVVSETQEVQIAIEAMRLHAFNYTSKDRGLDTVQALVTIAGTQTEQKRDFVRLREDVDESSEREFVVGLSAAIREIVELVQRVATRPANVLILGESGTGKELLARLIHRAGGRSDAPFVAVNLAAIPKELVESTLFGHEKGSFTGAIRQQIGKFELASGGTLFLDEVGDLRYELQAKLLRAIQEREIERVGGMQPIKTNLRLIAATNIDLDKAVKEGKFREDLFYRLNVVPIKMPALRDRIEDLPELARFFLRRYCTRFRKDIRGISEGMIRTLQAYWWPGNIRELENLLERLVAISDKEWLTEEDLPYELLVNPGASPAPAGGNVFDQAVDAFARNYLIRALETNGWNTTATARALGV